LVERNLAKVEVASSSLVSRSITQTMVTPFTAGLSSGDMQAIRACAKADLHTHGGANSDREYIRERIGRGINPLSVSLKSMDEIALIDGY
jgi:hypothetical protein